MYLHPPLEKMRETQPFGVDWVDDTGKFYAQFGLKGHNGWDGRAKIGTPVYACFDGIAYTNSNKGYGNDLRIWNDELGLEAVYGHLSVFEVMNGEKVVKGQLVALSGNTGMSTGPHLHFGLRRYEIKNGAGPFWIARWGKSNNGYNGCIDPKPFFDPKVFKLPVDLGYGIKPAMSVREFAKHYLYFIKATKRIPTFRQYRALRYGRWDIRTVLDDSMFPVWSEMTKPNYLHEKK